MTMLMYPKTARSKAPEMVTKTTEKATRGAVWLCWLLWCWCWCPEGDEDDEDGDDDSG
jgi:hypothetical protein